MDPRQSYPVRIEGELDPGVGRWLWLVKWLLAIPHYLVLVFLWLTFLVLTVVAFFAILFTGRYPRGIFDFNVGVLRWTWRVGFYSYAALGTDRYPPFTLHDVPDYPARLDVAYPERLSRGLVLVKSWLLAIPHYIVVGILLGGGSYAASRAYDRAWGFGYETGLIGVLVLFAGVALLFTTRYPRGIFDVVLGLDRWVARVAAYVFLMRDEYPPFRLDQGGAETARPPIEAVPAVELSEPDPAAAAHQHGTAGRVVLIVVGVVVGIVAFGLLAGGCALVAVDQTQRDDDGYLMSPSAELLDLDVCDRLRSRRHRRQRRRAGRSTSSSGRYGSAARATATCSSASARQPRSTATWSASSATSSPTSTTVTPPTRDGRAVPRPLHRAPRRSGPPRQRDPGNRRSSGSRRTATGAPS